MKRCYIITFAAFVAMLLPFVAAGTAQALTLQANTEYLISDGFLHMHADPVNSSGQPVSSRSGFLQIEGIQGSVRTGAQVGQILQSISVELLIDDTTINGLYAKNSDGTVNYSQQLLDILSGSLSFELYNAAVIADDVAVLAQPLGSLSQGSVTASTLALQVHDPSYPNFPYFNTGVGLLGKSTTIPQDWSPFTGGLDAFAATIDIPDEVYLHGWLMSAAFGEAWNTLLPRIDGEMFSLHGDYGLHLTAVTSSEVPEPGSMLLLLAGIGGALRGSRRNRSTKDA